MAAIKVTVEKLKGKFVPTLRVGDKVFDLVHCEYKEEAHQRAVELHTALKKLKSKPKTK